jgi:hypothetical protein
MGAENAKIESAEKSAETGEHRLHPWTKKVQLPHPLTDLFDLNSSNSYTLSEVTVLLHW